MFFFLKFFKIALRHLILFFRKVLALLTKINSLSTLTKMAVSQLAAKAEQAIGHDTNAVTIQDVTNPAQEGGKYGHPTETMKALAWMGKNTVQMVDVPKPSIIEDGDVILKITGSTVCGSDLHLLHGTVVELEKGDILGHEFCGIVDEVGSAVKKVKKGDRVVASFQIACGACPMCERKLSSQCAKTNANTIAQGMYGGRTAGMFGYSHFTGAFSHYKLIKYKVAYTNVHYVQAASLAAKQSTLACPSATSTSSNSLTMSPTKKAYTSPTSSAQAGTASSTRASKKATS